MKTVYMVRHAKSSWDFPELFDFDRPLNKRGKSDGPMMATKMSEALQVPDLLISSPANRALTTAMYFRDALGLSDNLLWRDSRLYHASVYTILEVLHELDPALGCVALFGHNPGFTSFANSVGKHHLLNLPTAGVAIIDSNTDSWLDFEHFSKMRTHYIPKQFK